MGDGEDAKTLATVDDLCRRFAQWGLLRGDAVVALGGGVVGDTAGFAAAVYYRGVDVVQVPDHAARDGRRRDRRQDRREPARGQEPRRRVPPADRRCSPTRRVLATLPDREYRCGLGEVAKYALMGDDFVTAARRRALRRAAIPRRARRRDRRAARRSRRDVVARRRARAHRAARRAQLRPHARARARDRGRPRAAARRGGRDRARVRGAARARCSSGSTPTLVDAHRALVARARPADAGAGRACAPTSCSRSWRATRRRAAGSRSCSPGRTGSSGSTIPTRPRCARRSRGRHRSGERLMATILLLSGPNLNLLGEREPETTAPTTLAELRRARARDRGRSAATTSSTCSRTTRASSSTRSTARAGRCAAIVINPGAFTHYAYALADALADVRRREDRGAPLEPVRPRGVAPPLGDRARRRPAPSPASAPPATASRSKPSPPCWRSEHERQLVTRPLAAARRRRAGSAGCARGSPTPAIDALLVTKLANVRYLTGFTGSAAMLLVTADDALFVTDGRYTRAVGRAARAPPASTRRIEIGLTGAAQRDALVRRGRAGSRGSGSRTTASPGPQQRGVRRVRSRASSSCPPARSSRTCGG